ncbi:MAG: hypothetical protein JWN24_4185 [Phycisphaerales bacterium]|nr:hypothetical protein [Phycisphaerales bacterium]
MLTVTAAQAAVVLVRLLLPTRRKWVTVTLNIILLPFVPWETALGVYGLWKVDKGEIN